ncbi:MAG: hypothetical protein WKF77_04515 [Planctomycetaceae bacterium]
MLALKSLFPAPSGSRRPKAEACGQAERLEVRQVLSVANLAVVMNAAALSQPEPRVSSFDAPAPGQTTAGRAVGEADPVAAEQDNPESLQNEWAESDSIWNLAGLSVSDRGSFTTVNTSKDLPNSSVAPPPTPSKIAVVPSASDDPLILFIDIDEAFRDSGNILDNSFPSSGIDKSVASASIVLPVPDVLTPSQNDPVTVVATPVVQYTARKLPVTVPVIVIPAASNQAPDSISSTSPPANGWSSRTSSLEFAARPQQTVPVIPWQSLTDSAAVQRSVVRPSDVFVEGDADHGWLAGLAERSWFSTDSGLSTWRNTSLPVAVDALPVAVPLVDYSADQQLSPQNLTITAQTKIRPFREEQRQNSTSTKLIEVCDQYDSLPDLIDSEDVPRALKYVVLPRGPPRKQPDTVLRLMDSDAEAHVLQRLRYSIAPRGPSTVTVEMQSPEKRSFSGPRVSPEESLSVRLVG